MQVSNNTLRNIWANKTQPVDTLSLPVGWVDGWAGEQDESIHEIIRNSEGNKYSRSPQYASLDKVRISCVKIAYIEKSSNFTSTVPPL